MRPVPVLCRCGHPRAHHDHFRDGSDCGACGKTACPGWRPAPWWWWLQRVAHLEVENRRLRAETQRLASQERTLRNVIALHPYNPGHPA